MAILIDSYSESNSDNEQVACVTAYPGAGQSFTGKKGKLIQCKFYLKKESDATGNAVAKLYAHSGTYGTSSIPTGTALAASGNLDVSTLTTSFQLITINFTGVNQYLFVNGTYYCLALEYAGAIAVRLGSDASSPSHSGSPFYKNGATWTTYGSGKDVCFYVYANPVVGGLGIGNPYIF